MKKSLLWVILGVVVLAGAAAYWLHSRQGSDGTPAAKSKKAFDPNRAIPVAVGAVKKSDVDLYLNGLGTIVPLRTVTVRSRVDGELVRVHFTEGQMVKEGDLLAEVDPRPFQVQLMQAEGQLAKDQALLANARIDLERYQTLFTQDSIAKQQVDTQASLVRQYEGAVKTDQSGIDNAKLQLTYARITAPVSGRLGLRQVDPGNVIHAADANGIVVITQLQPIATVFTIPQDQIELVLKKRDTKLPVEAWDRENTKRLATGALITVDNQIDVTTGTVKLKAQFPNGDGALFPNQFVNVRMLVDTLKNQTVVPSAAVQRGAQGLFVYVVKPDSTVTMRAVKLGPVNGPLTAVEEGLQPGDEVVTDGIDRLREGAKVAVPQAKPAQTQNKEDLKKGPRKKGSK